MATLSKQELAVARNCALLSRLTENDLQALIQRLDTVDVPARGAVFRQGQPADRFYLILAGSIRIYLLNARGDQQVLHVYGPGETFAEAAVLAEGTYPAWADAAGQSRLLCVRRDSLLELIPEHPRLALGMMAGLTGKLHEFAGLIEQLSLKEVPARLAAALLSEAEAAGSDRFELSQSKRQLAARLGTVAETLSRALAKLRKMGAIDVDGKTITILDPDQLEDVASS